MVKLKKCIQKTKVKFYLPKKLQNTHAKLYWDWVIFTPNKVGSAVELNSLFF